MANKIQRLSGVKQAGDSPEKQETSFPLSLRLRYLHGTLDPLVKWAVGIALFILLLLGCQSSNLDASVRWKTYRNPRFSFEFPYPSHWIPSQMPDNRDGQAFSAPHQLGVEIRGWASQGMSSAQVEPHDFLQPEILEPFQENFRTLQGVAGALEIEVGVEMSRMRLRLIQDSVEYNWQGRSPSQQFADYYRLFYYVASRYQIKSQGTEVRDQGSERTRTYAVKKVKNSSIADRSKVLPNP